MQNLSIEKEHISIPRNLKECQTEDQTAAELWRVSEVVEKWGGIILIVIIAIGLICSFSVHKLANSFSYEPDYSAFLTSAAVWGLAALIEYVTYYLIVLFVRAVASLVQNTKVSARVALYQATLSQVGDTDINSSGKQVLRDTKEGLSAERTISGTAGKNENSEVVVPRRTDANEIICPQCETIQHGNRKFCWKCGQRFI